MTTITEYSIKSLDGLTLHGKTWHTEEIEKGILCIIHGIGEHIGRYQDLAKSFNNIGYSVSGIDLRGHGISDGKRGHTPSYSAYINDLTILFNYLKSLSPKKQFIYGHSLGGNLVLNYILNYPKSFNGAIVTSPLLRLSFTPPAWKVSLAKIFNLLLPSISMSTNLKINDLSHNKLILDSYRNDPLVHNRITASTFINFISAGIDAIKKANTLKMPLLLMHGSLDAITSPKASKEFADLAGSICTFKLWEGYYHELHNEINQNTVIDYICEWLINT